MSKNSFNAKKNLEVAGKSFEIFDISQIDGAANLPYSLKVLLENLLRTEDGANITADHIKALAGWDPTIEPDTEIQFTPARVIMQDFTGVPCVVDLATMREAIVDLGGDPSKVNPLAPAELVIDHSVVIDVAGSPDAFERNVAFEYERNGERYQFLRWGQGAFSEFKVDTIITGISFISMSAFNSFKTVKPSFFGRITSNKMTSGFVSLAFITPASPSKAKSVVILNCANSAR